MTVIVIDNYDSFTYNLVHYLEDLNCQVTVVRNDQLILEDIENFDKILLSPGPGIPDEAGLLKTIIKTYASNKPILGVCLGQQAIAEVFGGSHPAPACALALSVTRARVRACSIIKSEYQS